MLICEYGVKDFEKQVINAIQDKQPFILKINGWRKCTINAGLRHYFRYLDSQRGGKSSPLSALLVIPFGFVTPTFWVICIQAALARMYPTIEQQSVDMLAVKFET